MDVFDEDPERFGFLDEPLVFEPEPRPCSLEALALGVGEADILAGEATCDSVDLSKVCPLDVAYVVEAQGVWPVMGQDLAAALVNLDLGSAVKPGPF